VQHARAQINGREAKKSAQLTNRAQCCNRALRAFMSWSNRRRDEVAVAEPAPLDHAAPNPSQVEYKVDDHPLGQ